MRQSFAIKSSCALDWCAHVVQAARFQSNHKVWFASFPVAVCGEPAALSLTRSGSQSWPTTVATITATCAAKMHPKIMWHPQRIWLERRSPISIGPGSMKFPSQGDCRRRVSSSGGRIVHIGNGCDVVVSQMTTLIALGTLGVHRKIRSIGLHII